MILKKRTVQQAMGLGPLRIPVRKMAKFAFSPLFFSLLRQIHKSYCTVLQSANIMDWRKRSIHLVFGKIKCMFCFVFFFVQSGSILWSSRTRTPLFPANVVHSHRFGIKKRHSELCTTRFWKGGSLELCVLAVPKSCTSRRSGHISDGVFIAFSSD